MNTETKEENDTAWAMTMKVLETSLVKHGIADFLDRETRERWTVEEPLESNHIAFGVCASLTFRAKAPSYGPHSWYRLCVYRCDDGWHWDFQPPTRNTRDSSRSYVPVQASEDSNNILDVACLLERAPLPWSIRSEYRR